MQKLCYPLMLALLMTGCGGESGSSLSREIQFLIPEKTIADCSAFGESDFYRPRSTQLLISAEEDWQNLIQTAPEDTEILLQDGIYELTAHTVQLKNNITVRSASGNRDAVHIKGVGYHIPAEGLSVTGDDVSIADISVSDMRDHAIAIMGGNDRTHIYNVNLYDIGTQHIKGNVGGINNGLIACSSIGYSDGGAVGDYNGGIDLHQSHGWQVAHNYLYNITGDGSGCLVDTQCGSFISGPAILVWNESSNVAIYDNTIVDSFRNISLGLGRGFVGGIVSRNLIEQSQPGDAGIELQSAADVLVEDNTVILGDSVYPGAIEYRQSSRIVVRNNQLTATPWDRGDNDAISVYDNTVVSLD